MADLSVQPAPDSAVAEVLTRIYRTSSRVRQARQWWRDRLDGVDPGRSLGELAGVRGSRDGGRRSTVVPLPDGLATRFAGYSLDQLLATLIAAAGVVAARYTQRAELLVGAVPPAGGPVLPIRLPLLANETRARLVERVRNEIRTAATFAEGLFEMTDPPEGNPVPAVCVGVGPDAPRPAEVVCVSRLDRPGVRLELDVDRGRITDDLADRLAEQLAVTCAQLVCAPDLPAGTVDVLGSAERATLLRYASSPTPTSPPSSLPCRIRYFARTQPDRLAVVCRDRRLSWGQLDRAARAVADRLAARGVRPGQRVALLLERGQLPVVAAVGTFLLGAVYVPCNVEQPHHRTEFMLTDADVRLVLTEPGSVDRVPPGCRHLVEVLPDPEVLAERSGIERPIPPDDAEAYTIYTSGTTGVPKAAVLTHRAYAATCEAYRETYGLTDGTPVALQLYSVAFDGFNGDLARSLFFGGTLVVCPDEVRTDVDALAGLIGRERVSILEAPPGLINPLAHALLRDTAALASLRVLISSSEAWHSSDYRAVRAALDSRGIRVFNTYGVTEAAIDSTACHPEELDPTTGNGYVPIGRALPGVRTYVLDSGQRPVPLGALGELHLGGPALASAYLGRPALTAARFVPDPFGADGGRLYRTGDVVRYRPDGLLEFAGRADNQIQLRGFRIELGEIEETLLAHEDVTAAVVTAYENEAGVRYLVAYVASSDAAEGRLRNHCAHRLPEYMVPAVFVVLARLPLNSNGKIDRKALPALQPLVGQGTASLRTDTEKRLARIWDEVLGVRESGADDDFFRLGGNSLLMLRLITAVNAEFGVPVSVQDVFGAPTLSALAARLDDQ
jgi:amino acid adenylation domain-containing protein